MKKSLLTSTVLLSLSSPLFADFLSDNLIDGGHYKDIPSARTRVGRSALYRQDYPIVGTVIHSYNHQPVATPFAGEIPEGDVNIPHSLADQIRALRASGYTISHAFSVQDVEQFPNSSAAHTAHPSSLKPQYWLFPTATVHGQATQGATVRWTATKGAVGNVDNAYQPAATFVSIHPENDVPGNQNVLSGDSLHLQGIAYGTTVDSYDLVVNDATKQGVLTYHWLLDDALLQDFRNQLAPANTFEGLLINLTNNTGGAFANLLGELCEYIGQAPRPAAPANAAAAYFPPIPTPPAPPPVIVTPAPAPAPVVVTPAPAPAPAPVVAAPAPAPAPAPVVARPAPASAPAPVVARPAVTTTAFSRAAKLRSGIRATSAHGAVHARTSSARLSHSHATRTRFASVGSSSRSMRSSHSRLGGHRFGSSGARKFGSLGSHRFGGFGARKAGGFGGFRSTRSHHRFSAPAA